MEQNVFQATGKTIAVGGMAGEALTALYDLRWMIAFIFVLVVADFWFGVKASLANKEKFRFSRAGRRTCNKFCDYIVYLIVGAVFGKIEPRRIVEFMKENRLTDWHMQLQLHKFIWNPDDRGV